MAPCNNTRSNSMKKKSNKQKKKQVISSSGGSNKRVDKTARMEPATATSESSPRAEISTNTTTTTTGTSPLFFFRENDPETGWLSQWYPSVFTDGDGVVYKTAEHYMMYHKALLFNDNSTAAEILAAETPREAKALGRVVTPFSVPLWELHRSRIVSDGTYLKFTSCHAVAQQDNGGPSDGESVPSRERTVSLRALLLGTGARQLVEASPFDRVWGIGCAAAVAPRRRRYWGMNLLGKVIMEVRGLLEQEEEVVVVGREGEGGSSVVG